MPKERGRVCECACLGVVNAGLCREHSSFCMRMCAAHNRSAHVLDWCLPTDFRGNVCGRLQHLGRYRRKTHVIHHVSCFFFCDIMCLAFVRTTTSFFAPLCCEHVHACVYSVCVCIVCVCVCLPLLAYVVFCTLSLPTPDEAYPQLMIETQDAHSSAMCACAFD